MVPTLQPGPPGGRDKRRRLSLADRREIALRANGLCGRCKEPLGDDWHSAHLISWTHGGATSLENSEAWCKAKVLANGDRTVSTAHRPALGNTVRRWRNTGGSTKSDAFHQRPKWERLVASAVRLEDGDLEALYEAVKTERQKRRRHKR